MQDRYAADVGDYVKLAILRHLKRNRRLGVLWWLYPNESYNADGKHITYLNQPLTWRGFDPPLFDGLQHIIAQGHRSVNSLEAANFLTEATYFSEHIPTSSSASERRSLRQVWFSRAQAAVSDCDLLFLDPDNGLETKNFNAGQRKAGKSVALSELMELKEANRSIIVYHHHTRMSGGNLYELAYWGKRLATIGFEVDALRAAVGTARAFFLLDATDQMRTDASHLADLWRGKLTWHPRLD